MIENVNVTSKANAASQYGSQKTIEDTSLADVKMKSTSEDATPVTLCKRLSTHQHTESNLCQDPPQIESHDANR